MPYSASALGVLPPLWSRAAKKPRPAPTFSNWVVFISPYSGTSSTRLASRGGAGVCSRWFRSARRDEAAFVGQHDGLGAVAEVQFCQDAADVGLGGLFGDDEGAADLGVGQAAGDQLQHFGLPVGERAERSGAGRVRAWPAGEVGDQPPGHRRGEQRGASGDHANGGGQVRGGGGPEQ